MEWAIKAAKAGKYILCEKPLAMNEEQVKKIFVAVKANHVLLEEAYAYRHAQLAQRVSLSIAARSVGSAIRRGWRDFERFFLRSAGPQCGAGNIQCRKGCREKSQRIHGGGVCGRQYPGAVAYVPGMIATEIAAESIEKYGDALLADIPCRRFGTPEDLGKVLVFLASDAAGYMNGCHVEISGGKRCVQNPQFSYQ